MMGRRVISLCLAWWLPTLLLADWATNAWPTYDYPLQGAIHRTEIINAINERHAVLGEAYIDTTRWPTQYYHPAPYLLYPIEPVQRKVLIDCKQGTGGLLTEFLATNHLAGGQTISDVQWTPLEWLQQHKLPTNYFEYTPYSCLAGVGPLTNDTTVGHPHGWTNAYTVNGGTDFPAGRARWYTTDYGWQGLQDILSSMTITYSIPGVATSRQVYGIGYSDADMEPTEEEAWATAKTYAEDDATADTWSYLPECWTEGEQDYHGLIYDFEAELRSAWASLETSAGGVTNLARQDRYYVRATMATNQSGPDVVEFYDYGTGLSTGWNFICSYDGVSTQTISSAIGDVDLTVPPGAWCDMPEEYEKVIKGYRVTASIVFHRWDFQYK